MTPALLLSFCLGIPAASGAVADTFTVNVSVDRLAVWVQAHADTIAQSTGAEVLWRQGNLSCVRKTTLRGSVWAVLEDRLDRTKDGGYRYDASLAKDYRQGGLRDYRLQVQVDALDSSRSRLSVRVNTTVDLPRVRDHHVQNRMAESLRRVRELLDTVR